MMSASMAVMLPAIRFLALLFLIQNKIAVATEIKFDGDELLSHIVNPLPHTYMDPTKLPKKFYWGNVGGKSYLTHMLNQHIPQCKNITILMAWSGGNSVFF
jgi:hypothetical protein